MLMKFFSSTGLIIMLCLPFTFSGCNDANVEIDNHDDLFKYNDHVDTRWSSPENRNGAKGGGGKENNTAKGHAFDSIAAGATYTLLDVQEQGMINRIWITINDRSPEMLRALKLEMLWDGETKPAVSVPLGDFFGVGLGQTTVFQNALFANAEGRSFNCFIQMPFKTGVKIHIVNESSRVLQMIFFDVDYSLLKHWNNNYMYFHAYWQRDTATKLAEDYEVLPQLEGRGRFLGSNIGVEANRAYGKSWFGEGEVKIYLDNDKDYPTLNGTGTEDYIGTAWGQGKFINTYTGCTVADDSLLQWAFYRYHIPDPVFFKTGCKVVLQQIGGDGTDNVAAYQKEGAGLIPVTTGSEKQFHPFYNKDSVVQLADSPYKGWTNFYRSDDVSAVAYFYLDKPSSNLKAIQPVALRTVNLRHKQ
ncbi:MAG: glycoside hydrolase family 172 protein [Panacibacter sp.]